jgi:di/tricarboxylate transporter
VRPAAEFKVLAALVLLLLDALLAVLVWLAAYELQSIWGRLIVIGWEGFPPLTAMVIGVFAVAVLCAAAAVTLNGDISSPSGSCVSA